MVARRRQRPGQFDNLYGRQLLRALAAMTTEGGPDGECWDWLGAFSTAKGRPTYPALSMSVGGRRRVLKAHRVSFAAAYGPIPPGEQVHHRCTRASCIRPEHLEAATGRANIGEMLTRRALEARISSLEAALRAYRPDHPALDEDHPQPDRNRSTPDAAPARRHSQRSVRKSLQ